MVTIPEFVRAVVPHGTGAMVIDPHEYANVLGMDGIRYVLESSKNLPIDFFIMLPSCVPATHLETAGARFTADDLALDDPRQSHRRRGRADELSGRFSRNGKRAGQNSRGQRQGDRWTRARVCAGKI